MSFHLLIWCIDLIYRNVLNENPDLINPKFVGVPPKWGKPDFDIRILKDYCIIEPICNMSNASPLDAKNMKETFKGIIKTFLKANVCTIFLIGDLIVYSCIYILIQTLYGTEDTLISNAYFERNLRSLKGAYEQYVLNMAELDERILLDYRKINSTRELTNI